MFLCGHSFPLCVKVFKTVFQVRASSLGISSFTVKRKTPLTLTSTHIRRFTRLCHWPLPLGFESAHNTSPLCWAKLRVVINTLK